MRRRINRHLHKTSFAGQMRRIKGEINGTTKTSRFVKNERRRFPKWTSHDQQDKPPMSVTFSWIRESLLQDEISTNRHNLKLLPGPTVEGEKKHDSYINQPAAVDSKLKHAKFLCKNPCECRHVDPFFLVCLFVLRTILGCRLSVGQLLIQDASTSLRLAQSIRAGPASVFQVKVSRHTVRHQEAPHPIR